MEYLFILFSFLILTPIVFFIYKISNGMTLNYISFWFVNFVVFCWVGAFLIAFGFVDDTYFLSPIKDLQEIKVLGGFVVLWGGAGPFLIFIFLFHFFKVNKRWNNIYYSSLKSDNSDVIFSLICFVLFLFCLIYYLYSTHPSPLYMALNNFSPTEIALRRIAVTKDLYKIANTYIISFGTVLAYFSTYSLYGLYVGRDTLFCKMLFYISFFMSCLYLLLSGEKASIVFFLLGLLFLFKFNKGQSLKVGMKLFTLVLAILFSIYYLLVSDDAFKIVNLLVDRLFIAQVISVYLSVDYYSFWGDIGFSSMDNFVTKLLDLTFEVPASTKLMQVYFHEMIAVGGWNLNGLYIHEAWSNFGFLGVVVAPIYVGSLNLIFLRFVLSFKKTAFSTALHAFSLLKCIYFLTSFNSYFYHSDWIWLTLILLLYLSSRIVSRYV